MHPVFYLLSSISFLLMTSSFDIGMVGLGVMGRNLVLNIADRGFAVAGFDLDPGKAESLRQEAGAGKVFTTTVLKDFVSNLKLPRAIILLVPAGGPVDAVIGDLLPHLSEGDILIDGGNSFFKDTERREKRLSESKIHFIGMGVSGGESGARHGPSLMPGGSPTAYERIRPILEAVAARVNDEPCVAHLGPAAAGHYVKIVHNGMEYGLIQLLAEAYDLMHRGLGLGNEEMHDIFRRWNDGPLNSYLVEITANIFRQVDPENGKHVLDLILDTSKQKGTGMWTAESGMELHVPANIIDTSVAWRNLSSLKEERMIAGSIFPDPSSKFSGDKTAFVRSLENAMSMGMIATFAQGMSLLRVASKTYGYGLNLETVARIWRGGCIIRAAVLEKIRKAFSQQPDLPNLLVDPDIAREVSGLQYDLRLISRTAIDLGIPAATFMAALGYFDGYRSTRLPSNLTQAQRDYFGAHTYERLDAKGVFHTHWEELKKSSVES